MKVTVYLGANMVIILALRKQQLPWVSGLLKNGHTLVYGGSRMGLMGVLGDTDFGKWWTGSWHYATIPQR